jgi:hypothetical protein
MGIVPGRSTKALDITGMRPRLRLGPKNESVVYRRPGLECELMCYLSADNRSWLVYESAKGRVEGENRPLSSAELAEIRAAVQKFLGRIWWLGLFPKRYGVEFVRQ